MLIKRKRWYRGESEWPASKSIIFHKFLLFFSSPETGPRLWTHIFHYMRLLWSSRLLQVLMLFFAAFSVFLAVHFVWYMAGEYFMLRFMNIIQSVVYKPFCNIINMHFFQLSLLVLSNVTKCFLIFRSLLISAGEG